MDSVLTDEVDYISQSKRAGKRDGGNMEGKLRGLFEYQRFQGNHELSILIADTQARYPAALSDEDISMVSAAGGEPVFALENIGRGNKDA